MFGLAPTWAFLAAHLVKNPPAMRRDRGSIPGLGRFPEEGRGYPLQYSGLENSMDCIVHGVAKSRIQLSDFHFGAQVVVVLQKTGRKKLTGFGIQVPSA